MATVKDSVFQYVETCIHTQRDGASMKSQMKVDIYIYFFVQTYIQNLSMCWNIVHKSEQLKDTVATNNLILPAYQRVIYRQHISTTI